MATDRSATASASRAGRIAFWGLTIAGCLGLVLAINAATSGQFGGAGACLAASALSFGAIGWIFVPR